MAPSEFKVERFSFISDSTAWNRTHQAASCFLSFTLGQRFPAVDIETGSFMKCITGGILIAAAEQAFAHSQLVQFPNHLFAQDILMPASAVLLALGTGFLVWGVVTECRSTNSSNSASNSTDHNAQ